MECVATYALLSLRHEYRGDLFVRTLLKFLIMTLHIFSDLLHSILRLSSSTDLFFRILLRVEFSSILSRTSECACYLEIEAGNELKLIFASEFLMFLLFVSLGLYSLWSEVHLNEMNRVFTFVFRFFKLVFIFYKDKE